MRLLLDTHVLLWWWSDASELTEEVRRAIGDPANMVYVSAVSVWEIVVKRALGKLEVPEDWYAVLVDEPFRPLPVVWEHARALDGLPDLHRDPFDRLLVAQARVEDLVMASHDADVLRYGGRTIAT